MLVIILIINSKQLNQQDLQFFHSLDFQKDFQAIDQPEKFQEESVQQVLIHLDVKLLINLVTLLKDLFQ
jgi:hypothetical protein